MMFVEFRSSLCGMFMERFLVDGCAVMPTTGKCVGAAVWQVGPGGGDGGRVEGLVGECAVDGQHGARGDPGGRR